MRLETYGKIRNMDKLLGLIVCFSLLALPQAQAAVYGEDQRYLVSEDSTPAILHWSKSVASQLRTNPQSVGQGKSRITWKSLKEHIGLCEDQKFSNVPTFSRCSGFLVEEDLLVTAGHCVNDLNDCKKYKWAFTSEAQFDGEQIEIKDNDLYTCIEIVNRVKNPYSKNDFALIRLNRSVKGRMPLKYRESGKIEDYETLAVIGNPSGLPLVVAPLGKILENDSPFLFKTNNDTFAGNSGSPVFNENTGLVEGILTDGETDYIRQKDQTCSENKQCTGATCRGENVVRITVIPELVPNMTPLEPVFKEGLPLSL